MSLCTLAHLGSAERGNRPVEGLKSVEGPQWKAAAPLWGTEELWKGCENGTAEAPCLSVRMNAKLGVGLGGVKRL